jgi:hypothetical protein
MKLKVSMNNSQSFVNKLPEYSKSKNMFINIYTCLEFKCYVLNYINRSIKSSFKNFQLIEENDLEQNVLLQFGEINANANNIDNNMNINDSLNSFSKKLKLEEYILDYTYPFSPLIAFGISISCIHKKLLCE